MFDRATSETELQVDGDWWLPGSSRKKVKGTLDISVSGRGKLRLLGQLLGKGMNPIELFNEPYKVDLINGISKRGDRVTLIDCTQTQYSLAGTESEFAADRIIIGLNVKKKERVAFHKIAFRFTHLEEWLDTQQIKLKPDFEKHEYIIAAEGLYCKEYKIEKGLNIAIESTCYIEEYRAVQTSAALVQKACIVIETKRERTLDELLELGNRIRTLLCFACQKPIYFDGMTGYSRRNMRKKPNGEKYSIPMQVHIRQVERLEKEDKGAARRELFTFRHVEECFDGVMASLMNNYETLRPLFECYIPWYYLERSYLEFRFLALLIGIERYHRIKYKGYELAKDEHKSRMREILATIPEEHQLWVKNKLQYSNEITLRARMNEIIEEYKSVLAGLYADKDEIISRTVDTRNYLVHGNKELKWRAKTPQEMFELMLALETIVDACLLRGLGVSNVRARELLTERRKTKKV